MPATPRPTRRAQSRTKPTFDTKSSDHAPALDQARALFFPGNGGDERQATLKWLDQIAIIRTLIAPLVIAHGLREGDEWVEPTIEFLRDDSIVIRQSIEAFATRLDEQGIDLTVAQPTIDDPNAQGFLDDAVLSACIGWGRCGYMLGIAIGTALRPDALKGRAR